MTKDKIKSIFDIVNKLDAEITFGYLPIEAIQTVEDCYNLYYEGLYKIVISKNSVRIGAEYIIKENIDSSIDKIYNAINNDVKKIVNKALENLGFESEKLKYFENDYDSYLLFINEVNRLKDFKNIFLVPTDKPSRLCLNSRLTLGQFEWNITENKQHLYIVSDEEIKGTTWCLNIVNNSIYKTYSGKGFNVDTDTEKWRKICLTTDQDLIKDGSVQSIDDEFLEKYVKELFNNVDIEKYAINCSCENQAKAGFGDNKIYENSTCHERNRCQTKYKIVV